MATRADTLRYDSIFVTDHVVLPASMARSVYPYSTTGQLAGGAAQDYLEPLAMLGYLAHATKRVRLGTSVLVVPYRNPLVAAKTLATIDQLSGGRVILGAGVGWLREEFEALATPAFENRGAVTDEYLKLMRATWTADPVPFEGKHYLVRNVHALPKPAQRGGNPLWIRGRPTPTANLAPAPARTGDPTKLPPPPRAPPRAVHATMISQGVSCALNEAPHRALCDLLARASEVRDRGRGRVGPLSARVFVPLTPLCRGYCGCGTFRRDPGEPGSRPLTREEV